MSKYIKRASSQIKDEQAAIDELSANLSFENIAGIIFFCSSNYDLKKLEDAINQKFSCPIIGCTTAGEVTDTYQANGIVAVSFNKDKFSFHSEIILDEKDFTAIDAQNITAKLKNNLELSNSFDPEKMFAFLLNDGMSAQEEKVTSLLYNTLDGIGLFGGSAGDDYKFENAPIFADGKFHNGAGVLAIIETTLDFKIYKVQHYTSGEEDMVITAANPAERIVYEINGEPAAKELADIIGINKEELAMKVYSTNPLMLEIGNEWYVRSIQQVFDDGSISFACAIDDGIPLTVGKTIGLVESLQETANQIHNEFSNIELTLACECVHRRLEIEETGIKTEVENILQDLNFIGFATYGEQFNAVHVNQTLTCVVIGEA